MPDVHCFTSISFSYLDRARILAETVRRHHPDWTIWLMMSDRAPEGFDFDLRQEGFDHIVWIDDLPVENRKGWIFKHDVVELCTAVKGLMMTQLLDQGAEIVVYLDPDTAIFSPLVDVLKALERQEVVLTPHLSSPERSDQGVLDNEIGTLKHGVFNLGFAAVRNGPEGLRFAAWWRDRLIQYCYDDIPRGLFTDQKWCDLAPAFFDVCILRDPGYNTASWNLSNRPISIARDGTIMAGDRPLRFFHFTKVNAVGETMLARYSGARYEIFELVNWYRRRLQANAAPIPPGWWYYGCFADAQPIRKEHRQLYRHRQDLQNAFPDPFEAGPDGYAAWYAANATIS